MGIDQDKLDKLIYDMGAKQGEILEAIEARKGAIGNEYAFIVYQAATTLAVMEFCRAHTPDMNSINLLKVMEHAKICVMMYAAGEVEAIYGEDISKKTETGEENPKLLELLRDIRSVFKQVIGNIPVENSKETD